MLTSIVKLADGTWLESEFTGTGFPLVFYLRYHYYRVYFPLMALSLYAQKASVANVAVLEALQAVPDVISIQNEAEVPAECILRFDPAHQLRERPRKPRDAAKTSEVSYLRLYCG